MSANKLFSSFTLGSVNLANRVVMAPMTRCRSTADHIPTEPMVKYYADRAYRTRLPAAQHGAWHAGVGTFGDWLIRRTLD